MDITLQGYDYYFQLLTKAFEHNILAHSILFSGIAGQGKSIFARQLAYYFLTHSTSAKEEDYAEQITAKHTDTMGSLLDLADYQPIHQHNTVITATEAQPQHAGIYLPSPQDSTYKRMISQGHPDYIYIDGENENSIKIDSIHAIIEFSHKTPVLSTVRVVIVDNFNKVNTNASNAILKLLEEPPQNLFLLLISHNAEELLDTIRSRCLHFKIPNLAYDDWRREILHLDTKAGTLNDTDMALLYHLCQGSLGQAIKILTLDFLAIYAELVAILREEYFNPQQVIEFANKINDTQCPMWLVHDIINYLICQNLKILSKVLPWDPLYIFSKDIPTLYKFANDNRQNLNLIKNLYMSEPQMFVSLLYKFKS